MARWGAQGLVLLGLWLYLGQGLNRLMASRWLIRAEVTSLEAWKMGPAGGNLLRSNLDLLKKAEAKDPLEPGIPIAIGAVHLLLGSSHAAIDAYDRALGIEWRPETYLNLGRAQRRAGLEAKARESFHTALKLDSQLTPEVEAELKAMKNP